MKTIKTCPWLAILLLVSIVSPTFSAQPAAATVSYSLNVTTDHPSALYAKSELVQFNIYLTNGKKPVKNAEVEWTLTKDGMPPISSGTLALTNGNGSVSGKLDEPGFIQCRVTYVAPTKKSFTFVAGAGVDPLQIRPSMPAPEDFDAFWDAKKRELAKIPVKARLTPVDHKNKQIECFDVQADSLGAPVSAYFARPVGAKPKSLPIILTVHGAGVRSSELETTAKWAGENMLAMDMNAHGLPNGKPVNYYNGLANGELKDYRTRGRESRETIYFEGMFLRLVRAIDFLTSQPEWDGRTLVVHGSSQGGAQSIVAAGLDSRVTFFAAAEPALCDHTGITAGRINGWPKFIAMDEKPDPKVIEAVRYYDVVNFAARTKAAGIVSVGFIDTTCPPTSVYAAYNALGGQKQIFNDPPSIHFFSPQARAALQGAIRTHVKR